MNLAILSDQGAFWSSAIQGRMAEGTMTEQGRQNTNFYKPLRKNTNFYKLFFDVFEKYKLLQTFTNCKHPA